MAGKNSKIRGCWPAVKRYLIEVKKPVSIHEIIANATMIRHKNGKVYEGRPLYKSQKCPTPRQLQQILKADKNVERIEEGHTQRERDCGKWRWIDENEN